MAYYKQTSATAQVKVGAGKLIGYIVSSTSSGTLKFYDSPAASTSDPVIINTVTPSAGASAYFGPNGIQFSKGLYVVAANTIEVTLIYE
jgi:hypothetical protein